MKMYEITEKQMEAAISASHDAASYWDSWGDELNADDCRKLASELEYQAIATERKTIDEHTKNKLVIELFKMGKYLDLLESTFSTYCEEDAKEMLGNVWQCRDYMEVLLRNL